MAVRVNPAKESAVEGARRSWERCEIASWPPFELALRERVLDARGASVAVTRCTRRGGNEVRVVQEVARWWTTS